MIKIINVSRQKKNHATSQNKKQITQLLVTKKSCDLLRQKKRSILLGPQNSRHLSGQKKSHNLWGQKEILQPLGTRKNHATSWNLHYFWRGVWELFRVQVMHSAVLCSGVIWSNMNKIAVPYRRVRWRAIEWRLQHTHGRSNQYFTPTPGHIPSLTTDHNIGPLLSNLLNPPLYPITLMEWSAVSLSWHLREGWRCGGSGKRLNLGNIESLLTWVQLSAAINCAALTWVWPKCSEDNTISFFLLFSQV